ncbi:2OG-Fe(II) oxygenase [Terrimonas sp. NA20]|uniref:2OG-Fe(II) oxygenase n=1 Tax=Terrimonas ginsenosidimutans TaxID=2908004 RepID=A0ABS9KKR4_9BACT|nr:2OG-Fe(II) oxygenase [Terrimonas ginsenosidimutans]MCG2612902.1 2OG-Fe(II) oxygenase [Terrimonas ginsenosidimutans]
MKSPDQIISNADWISIADQLNECGFAHVPGILNSEACDLLIDEYDDRSIYRKTVIMERHRFGKGEYKYFRYPLPEPVQTLRENLYPFLAPIANGWMELLKIDTRFPGSLKQLKATCHAEEQKLPTPLILRYGKGGFNTLHQDLYGKIFFPMQAVLLLNDPLKDFQGGEFILLEQIPRAQSKAIVLTPSKGDMIIFTTQFRPAKGSKGFYRVNMKHGVSEVRSGRRHSLGIIFHDATS